MRLRRFAALVSIALAGLLAAAGDATAAPAPPLAHAPSRAHGGQTAAAAELEEEVEWEWGEEEEWEEGEEEIEVELEFEEEAPLVTEGAGWPAECALQSVSARVVASDTSDTLQLSLRYASREPVRVDVHYSLNGVREAPRLDLLTLRATRHGRIDYTEHPGARRMSKVRAARTLVVTIEVPGAPRSCRSYAARRLTFRQHSHAHTIWSEAPRRLRAHR